MCSRTGLSSVFYASAANCTRCSAALGRARACADTDGQDDRCPSGPAAIAALGAAVHLESDAGMVSAEWGGANGERGLC